MQKGRQSTLGKMFVQDFERCCGDDELCRLMEYLNKNGYPVIAACQNGENYTVFFRRPAHG